MGAVTTNSGQIGEHSGPRRQLPHQLAALQHRRHQLAHSSHSPGESFNVQLTQRAWENIFHYAVRALPVLRPLPFLARIVRDSILFGTFRPARARRKIFLTPTKRGASEPSLRGAGGEHGGIAQQREGAIQTHLVGRVTASSESENTHILQRRYIRQVPSQRVKQKRGSR
jgi:hypothetical protein